MTEESPSEKTLSLPPLVTMGDPRLGRPSRAVPVEDIPTPGFQARLEVLAQGLTAYEGIGIAAPQIGWFERYFAMMMEPVDDPEGATELLFWINPVITHASEELCWAWEGCLSVPGLRGWIRRPEAIAVRGLNPQGETVSMEFRGWNARLFQHEFDHLEGMLYPYRALDPRHVVMTEQLERRDQWPDGWPTPLARDAPIGAVIPD